MGQYIYVKLKDNKMVLIDKNDLSTGELEELTQLLLNNVNIRIFRLEDITQYYTEEQLGASYENAGACITELVERTPGIIAFVPQQFVVVDSCEACGQL